MLTLLPGGKLLIEELFNKSMSVFPSKREFAETFPFAIGGVFIVNLEGSLIVLLKLSFNTNCFNVSFPLL